MNNSDIQNTMSILIVDDSMTNRMLAQHALPSPVYDVTAVDLGQVALDLLSEREFDAVLLDIMMPDIDGLQICRLIRENPEIKHIPIIMLTGLTQPDDIAAGFEAGANDYVVKPFNPVELKARINSVVSHSRAAKRILEQEQRIQAIMNNVAEGIITCDTNGVIEVVNETAKNIFGYQEEGLIGEKIDQLTSESSFSLIQIMRGGKQSSQEIKAVRKNGEPFFMELTISELQHDDKNLFILIIRDITDRKEADQALISVQSRLQYLLISGPAVIYTRSAKNDSISFISENVLRLLKYAAWQFTESSKFFDKLIHADDKAEYLKTMKLCHSQNNVSIEYRLLHEDGNYRWIQDEMRLIKSKDKEELEIVGSWMDVTDRRQAEELLQEMAMQDSMTGLYNHKAFFDQLESISSASRRHKQPLSFVMCDIDLFKTINDSYGHQIGDTVLVQFSKLIKEQLRTEDIAGRYGGDEFAIILPYTKLEIAKEVVERLRNNISGYEFTSESGETFHISATFGISELKKDLSNKQLIDHADIALYQAKENGRNQTATYDEKKPTS